MLALPNLGRTIGMTIAMGLGSAVFAVITGVALGWWASRLCGTVGRIARAVPLFPILIPQQVTVLGWTFLLSPQIGYLNQFLRQFPPFNQSDSGPFDIYHPVFMVVVMGLSLVPFVFFFSIDAFSALGSSLESAAIVSGASKTRVFTTITLPLLRPAIVYSFALVVVLGAGQFTVPLLLGRPMRVDVLTTEIFRLNESYPVQYGLMSALASPLILLGILIVFAQRKLIGETRRYIVGRDEVRSNTARWWGVLPIVAYACVVVLPLLAVAHIAFSSYWRQHLTLSDYTLAGFQAVLEDDRIVDALFRSLRISLITVIVVVALTFFVAMAIAFGQGAGRIANRITDVAVNIPLGVPATVLGMGALLTYAQHPFRWYGTEWIMVVVFITIMLPFATRLQLSALSTQGVVYRDASSVSGASSLRTVVKVVAPLARQGIVSSITLTFVMCLYEFNASLMVGSAQNEVVGRIFFDYYTSGSYPQLAALSLLMMGLATLCVIVVLLLGADRRHDATLAARTTAIASSIRRRLKPAEAHTKNDRVDQRTFDK
jgi:iron(III) transport system permease protein